jgi:hypothetical protein
MQKQTNKARNEGRYVNLGGGNAMKSRGADPSNLAGKGGRGTGLNLAKKTKQVDIKAAAAKRKATDTMTAAEKRSKANRANSQGGPTAAQAKGSAKNFNVGVSKGGVSFKEAFKHFKSKGQSSFTWNGKKYTTDVAKAKPKAKVSTPTPADFTMTGKKTAPKKAAPKKAPSTKSRDKNGLGVKSKIPAGAKPFRGGYNNKTHKLQTINGKTYVVKR